jgi:hypothetical protein
LNNRLKLETAQMFYLLALRLVKHKFSGGEAIQVLLMQLMAIDGQPPSTKWR